MRPVPKILTKGDVDRAGRIISASSYEINFQLEDYHLEEAYRVVSAWRACHASPLQAIRITLETRAKRIDPSSIIAQRLKRISSIAVKLQHNRNMKLSQMQDIGGCRAVMGSVNEVDRVLALYSKAQISKPWRSEVVGIRDYISSPKPDGYRSAHVIMKYQSTAKRFSSFRGQRIEIQIRSKIQHAWATAVEIFQTLTGYALKTKIKAAKPEWIRFFALVSAAMAISEGRPVPPGTPCESAEIIDVLRALPETDKILEKLAAWGYAIDTIPVQGGADAFLLILDLNERSLGVHSFGKREQVRAHRELLEIEMKKDPNVDAVLVSAASVSALRKAYPNYYGDTTVFLAFCKELLTKTV